MKKLTLTLIVALLGSIGFINSVQAEQTPAGKDAEYTKVITERARKIVMKLHIADSVKFYKVQDIITDQYRGLNTIHDNKNGQVKALKADTKLEKELREAKIKKIEDSANKKLAKQHKKYLAKLSKKLSKEQIDQVKDGMTFSVLPITYTGYLEMLPALTEKQKSQILEYLTEAREYAMDAESSEKKHAWFGKYKGKINNYLSAEGVETKKARQEWERKLKERHKKN